MKKILSTVLVGALIAGIAFAEVSFEYKGTAIVGETSKYLGNTTRNGKDYATTTDSKTGNQIYQDDDVFGVSGAISRTDEFTLGAKNDFAGVEIEFMIEDAMHGSDKAAANGVAQTASNKFTLDHFYGYLTFGLPVGSLQITSGKWDARWVSRIKDDAGDLTSKYYEAYKPGVIEGFGLAKDIDNLTGSKNMSTVLAYTLEDTLPGKLMFKFGLVGLQNDPLGFGKIYNEGSSDDTEIKAGFVGQVSYQQDDLFKFNVDFKTLKQNAYAFGLFFSPLMIENLKATLGFSMGIYNIGEKVADADRADRTEWGVDLRLRYAINEKVAITTMHNISGRKLTPNSANKAEEVDTMAMWNMISASVVAGDNIRFLATIQNINKDWKASNPTANTFAITPACEIKAGEKVKVTTAFDIRWTGVAPYAGTGNISLPIYVKFSL